MLQGLGAAAAELRRDRGALVQLLGESLAEHTSPRGLYRDHMGSLLNGYWVVYFIYVFPLERGFLAPFKEFGAYIWQA